MKSIKSVPVICPVGPMHWERFGPWFQQFLREEFRKMDLRDPQQGPLYGRTTAVPTLLTHISDTGQARSQRLLNPVSAGNKQSTQSVQPLSAADLGGGVAEITVGAHSITYGFGVVAYNSGVITGLLNSTVYYVYFDDPEYEGGAVTYLATTNANLITAVSGRNYVGKITTPAGGGGGTSGGWGGGGGGGGNPLP